MKKILISLFLLFSFSFGDISNVIPKPTGKMVNDFANMLNSGEEQNIEQKVLNHNNKTSNEIVVVTVNNLSGYTIENYALHLGRNWEIGKKDKNNGIVFLISKEDRSVRIEVGYGLEGKLTDSIAKQIINNTIVPNFKNGDFGLGISLGVDDIIDVIKGEYTPKDNSTVDIFIFIFALLLTVVFPLFIQKSKNRNVTLGKIGFAGIGGSIVGLIFAIAGYGVYSFFAFLVIFGLLFWKITDNFVSSVEFTSDSDNGFGGGSSRSSGGGFSGGGGSFGGGGSSGRW